MDLLKSSVKRHLEEEVGGSVVGLDRQRTDPLQDGLVGGVKPLHKPRVAVIVQSIRRVVWLVGVVFVVPQEVRVKVTVSRMFIAQTRRSSVQFLCTTNLE